MKEMLLISLALIEVFRNLEDLLRGPGGAPGGALSQLRLTEYRVSK